MSKYRVSRLPSGSRCSKEEDSEDCNRRGNFDYPENIDTKRWQKSTTCDTPPASGTSPGNWAKCEPTQDVARRKSSKHSSRECSKPGSKHSADCPSPRRSPSRHLSDVCDEPPPPAAASNNSKGSWCTSKSSNSGKSICSDCKSAPRDPLDDCGLRELKKSGEGQNSSVCECNDCALTEAARYSPFSSLRSVPAKVGKEGPCKKKSCDKGKKTNGKKRSRSPSPCQRYKASQPQVVCSCSMCQAKEPRQESQEDNDCDSTGTDVPPSSHSKVCSSCLSTLYRKSTVGPTSPEPAKPSPGGVSREWISARTTSVCDSQADSQDNIIWLSEKKISNNSDVSSVNKRSSSGSGRNKVCNGSNKSSECKSSRKYGCVVCPAKKYPNIKILREENPEGHCC